MPNTQIIYIARHRCVVAILSVVELMFVKDYLKFIKRFSSFQHS